MTMTTHGLIVPGLNGSGPGHWQTLWEEHFGFDRVRQRDWDRPDAHEWVETLDQAILSLPGSILIVAHSLGCLTVAQWAETHPDHAGRIRAALLVTAPDLTTSLPVRDAASGFIVDRAFAPALPLYSRGSENDPHMTLEAAGRLAASLGSRFANAGRVGHINVDSGHGPWPDGVAVLRS